MLFIVIYFLYIYIYIYIYIYVRTYIHIYISSFAQSFVKILDYGFLRKKINFRFDWFCRIRGKPIKFCTALLLGCLIYQTR